MNTDATEVGDDVLSAVAAGGRPDIGALWQICLQREWDRDELLEGISDWLGPSEGLRVLDCACGSGFPALELIKRGYDVTCSDGSALMLAHFRENARKAGLAVEPLQLLWEQLAGRFLGVFDVVMCRGGGSLIYAGTWDENLPPDRNAVTTALQSFYDCLRPGGRLYVDTTRADDLARPEPQREQHPTRVVDSHVVELEEEVANYPQEGIRVWRSWLRIDGTTHEFVRRSHYFSHEEFADMLTGAGFADVHPETVCGETYAVFVGSRPTSDRSLSDVLSAETITATATRPATPQPHQGSAGATA